MTFILPVIFCRDTLGYQAVAAMLLFLFLQMKKKDYDVSASVHYVALKDKD